MQKTIVLVLLLSIGSFSILTPAFGAPVECAVRDKNGEVVSTISRERGGLLTGVDPCCVTSGECTIKDFSIALFNIGRWIVGISASIALAFIIFGGGMMILSAGNTTRIEQGKNMLRGSVIGLTIIMISWVVVNFIVIAFTGTNAEALFGGGTEWYNFTF